jgi:TM2 domain-containing membrane protein YozV
VSGREFSICYFCWTFIPAVVGLIEGIIYLSMSDASFEEKHG